MFVQADDVCHKKTWQIGKNSHILKCITFTLNASKIMMEYLHTMVRIANIKQSLDFYCEKMGFVEVSRYDNEKARFTVIFLAADGDVDSVKSRNVPALELTYNWDEHEYQGGRNFGHIAYRVDNIYAYCQELMDKGVVINRPPRDGNMAFIKSPDGISFEILQRGEPLISVEPWISMPNIGSW